MLKIQNDYLVLKHINNLKVCVYSKAYSFLNTSCVIILNILVLLLFKS